MKVKQLIWNILGGMGIFVLFSKMISGNKTAFYVLIGLCLFILILLLFVLRWSGILPMTKEKAEKIRKLLEEKA